MLEGWAEADGAVSGESIAARLVEKIRFVRFDDVGSDLKLLSSLRPFPVSLPPHGIGTQKAECEVLGAFSYLIGESRFLGQILSLNRVCQL